MKTLNLPRMQEAPRAQTPALGKRYADTLGYTVLLNTDTKEATDHELFEACVAAEVRPFRTEAVKRYMANTKIDGEARYFRNWARAGLAAGLGLVGALIYGNATGQWAPMAWAGLLGLTVGIGGGLLGVMLSSSGSFHVRSWDSISLGAYRRPVPAAVLDMAVRIKEANKRVEFRVHELVISPRNIDPFLSVHLGAAEFFVAVWDEPKFDAKFE